MIGDVVVTVANVVAVLAIIGLVALAWRWRR